MLGSHLPMSRKLVRDFAALLGDPQSPIKSHSQWCNKKKEKARKKETVVTVIVLTVTKRNI